VILERAPAGIIPDLGLIRKTESHWKN
jgi:hypothetical protein